MIGITIGNYKVLSLIAEGGMGSVYLAEHPSLGRRAAIKILHPMLAGDPQVVSRFFTEARAANAIRHPNIVEIYDCGALPGGSPYLLMEYLEGESLAERIRRGALTLREAVDIAHQAAAGLAAAHAQGIVHRDLKPDNIFLSPDPRGAPATLVKILDFGIAKLQRPLDGLSHKTRTGVLMGTPVYMSPEQCLGLKEVDTRSDIYSLGVILYEMLCGRPPFQSQGVGALIHMHIGEAPPSAHSLNPEIPPELDAAVMRTLAKAPEDRFATMDEFRVELAAVLQMHAGLPDAHTPVPGQPTRPGQTTFSGESQKTTQLIMRGRGWLVAGCIAALALGAAAFWKLRSGRAPSPVVNDSPAPAAVTLAPTKAARPNPTSPDPSPAPQTEPAGVALPTLPSPAVQAPPAPPAVPSTFEVKLESEPSGATVRVGDVVIGETPVAFKTHSSEEPVEFTFVLEGHQRQTVKALPSPGLRLKPRLDPLKAAPAPRPVPHRVAVKRAPVSAPGSQPEPKIQTETRVLNDIKTER